LTEHHVITLNGVCAEAIRVENFYGCGSLSLHAASLGDCVLTQNVYVSNCSVPVAMENLKWELGSSIPQHESCITCSASEVTVWKCSFNGYLSPDQGAVGRGATTINRAYYYLRDCEFHNLEIAVDCYYAGHIDIIEAEKEVECSGNSIGVYIHISGLVLLSNGLPPTLGGIRNVIDGGGAIIQNGKFI